MTPTMRISELESAFNIVEAASAPVILELGAHHGNDTIQIYDACKEDPYYLAVEADPRNIATLINRVAYRRVTCAHYAIAAYCGVAQLHLSDGPDATGSSSIRTPKAHLEYFPTTRFERTVGAPALTLDALVAYYGVFAHGQHVDLIWCDIQGAERDMIAGGQKTLERTAYLLCECDAVEMYEGQVTRDGLLDLLPGWSVIAEWPENANVLLRNETLASWGRLRDAA